MKRSRELLQVNVEKHRVYKAIRDEAKAIEKQISALNDIPSNEIDFETYTLKRNLEAFLDYKKRSSEPEHTLESERIARLINYELAERLEGDEELAHLCDNMERTQTDESERIYHDKFDSICESEFEKLQPMIDELESYLQDNEILTFRYMLNIHRIKRPIKETILALRELQAESRKTGLYTTQQSTKQLMEYKYKVKVV